MLRTHSDFRKPHFFVEIASSRVGRPNFQKSMSFLFIELHSDERSCHPAVVELRRDSEV